MQKAILDLDGVLVDFVGGAAKQHGVQYPDPYPNTYDIAKAFNMQPRFFWEGLRGSEFWEGLNWMPDGKLILQILEIAFGSENIVICTSPTLDPEAASGKIRWIQRELPQYARQFLIGPAKHFCAGPSTLIIDDHDANVKKFVEHGGKGILIPRPWNSNHDKRAIIHLQGELWKLH